jgi:hypothetical protein
MNLLPRAIKDVYLIRKMRHVIFRYDITVRHCVVFFLRRQMTRQMCEADTRIATKRGNFNGR